MALTPERIDAAYREVWSTVPHKYRLSAFAEEIAAEVRKDDEQIIRQMLAMLESGAAFRHEHETLVPPAPGLKVSSH